MDSMDDKPVTHAELEGALQRFKVELKQDLKQGILEAVQDLKQELKQDLKQGILEAVQDLKQEILEAMQDLKQEIMERTQEAIRDSQTEMLKAFFVHQETSAIRMRATAAKLSN